MSEKITDLVKKLLRLARCNAASPAEAAQALNRAMELIDRHRLDIAALDLDEETEKLVCEQILVGERISFIKRKVNVLLLLHFKVRTCWRWRYLAIVGFENDVTLAGYAFDFLVRACTRATSDFAAQERKARRKVNATKKKNFIVGWMYGVSTNLIDPEAERAKLDDSKTALVIAERKKRVESFYHDQFPKATPTKQPEIGKNRSALYRGFKEGEKVTITTPLPSGSSPALFLE